VTGGKRAAAGKTAEARHGAARGTGHAPAACRDGGRSRGRRAPDTSLARGSHLLQNEARRLGAEGGSKMPIILWLLGVPLSLIVILWLLGVFS
jgi:hypothetical protein